MNTANRRYVFGLGILILAAMLVGTFYLLTQKPFTSAQSDFESYRLLGERVQKDFNQYPLKEIQNDYTITDSLKDGVDIQFANKIEDGAGPDTTSQTARSGALAQVESSSEGVSEPAPNSLSLAFPEDLNEPLAISLPGGKVITVTHNVEESYTRSLLTNSSEADVPIPETKTGQAPLERSSGEVASAERAVEPTPTYVKYTSTDSRINTYYAYQKDQAAGYRNLKHWTIFERGDGHEERSYYFTNAHISLNDNGEAEVRYLRDDYQSSTDIQNQVGQDLWERAKVTLGSELNADIENQPVDFTIPAPYIIDSLGNLTTLEWSLNETNDTLSLTIDTDSFSYPIALDPTLQFTAPGVSNAGDVITGESASQFGNSLTTGDFNADGKDDLAVGASSYSSGTGRVYIFYGGSSATPLGEAADADVIITGEASSKFGDSLTTGDFNADGQDDLVVGATGYSSNTGRTYIFYGDGSIPTSAASADVIITGGATNNYFGISLTTGDFNADGKDDLAVGAYYYSSQTGRTYIFYGDGSIPTTAATADVIITGQATYDYFGRSLTTGDLNADGKDDLVVGASGYSSNTGRTYIFYGDGSIPTTAATADVTITGEADSRFGWSLETGDFNADGQDDLVVGATGYSSNTGRTYIFYGDGSIPTSAASADVIITGGATNNYFGISLTTGDFNADGKDDLAVGAYYYSSQTGRTYIFYGDGSIPTTAATADVIITGQATYDYFGRSLTTGDLNADGKDDLVVGASGYSSNTGRTYIFYSQSGQVNLNSHVTGEGTGDYFGSAMTTGDFNNDGRDDLAVGAYKDATNTGKVYIFYGGSLSPSLSAGSDEDITITGEDTNNRFGYTLDTGDFNNDGKDDLAVGAYGYSSFTGRTYIFYGDGSIPTTAATADVIITGEANSLFGWSLTTGDFNADGKDDLAVGATGYSSNTGRTYIFYGDGSIPTTAATADVIITGGATNNFFGNSLTTGDFNNDGKDDLAVGAHYYSSFTGRTYIFYGDGSIPTTAATADVTITGETSSDFGSALTTGDFNADGKDDLAVGATGYSSFAGRTYIFYGDGSIPTTAATADVIITGEADSYFGASLQTGDFNADGKDDLAVGATGYSSNTGRTYIFYGDGSIPTTAATADVIITGGATNNFFGNSLTTGDFNNDGKDDLAVGAHYYSSFTGRTYIFYGDGSIPTTAGTADVIITGETISDRFGWSLATGDLNADGTTDLIVGAYGYNSNQGRIYMYTTNDYQITGEGTNSFFGTSLASGDFNNDGKTDLAVGATGWDDDDTGRVYIFYGGNKTSANASGADVILTGEASGNYFGRSLTTGDFNNDGTDDLVVGAFVYNALQGRAYIFYGGSMVSENASGADITLTGEAMFNRFGYSLATGDLNADGTDDLVVGAFEYNSDQGRAYVFYGGSMVTENASGADVTLTGEATDNDFGVSLATGDLNADGKDDLAVGAYNYSSGTGRAYVFYGGSMVTENASGADVTLTGEATFNYFGTFINIADLNADGTEDLVVSSYGYNGDGSLYSGQGRVYIFSGGSLSSANASNADAIITGNEESVYFGVVMTTGDVNADDKEDLLIGALNLSSGLAEVSFFYGGSLVDMNADQAGLTFSGGGLDGYLNPQFITADINNNGVDDFIFSADGYDDPDDEGRVYILMSEASAEHVSTMKINGTVKFNGSVKFH